jgi:hypothetical protein
MTFEEMATEMVVDRFGINKRSRCERWLNHRMAMVWAHAEWPFKKAEREVAAVDADGELTMPSTFRRMLAVEGSDENWISYVNPAEFRAMYSFDNTESSSHPTVYTVSNGTAFVRPKGTSEVRIAYERRMCHLASGLYVAGPMDDDDDEPVWDSEFHYLLVAGATATGLKTENDPTWESLEGEYQMGLAAMKEEYLPPDGVVNRQYGRIED